jgi:hypothetical protein
LPFLAGAFAALCARFSGHVSRIFAPFCARLRRGFLRPSAGVRSAHFCAVLRLFCGLFCFCLVFCSFCLILKGEYKMITCTSVYLACSALAGVWFVAMTAIFYR